MPSLSLQIPTYIFLVIFLSFGSYADTKFINEIPDFTQTHFFGSDGDQYCAPVAASNSLVWLSNNKQDQVKMIEKLASKSHMDTRPDSGTNVTRFIRGVTLVSRELFGNNFSIEYQGWRPYADGRYSSTKIPDMNWIATSVSKNSAVWLNVGWYKTIKNTNEYLRIGGHWVTVVGSLDDSLVIHDPSPRSGQHFSNNTVKYKPLNSGLLTGKEQGLPVTANGYYMLSEGLPIKSGADLAIVDGAVRLNIGVATHD